MRICGACRARLHHREWHCSACGWSAPEHEGVTLLLDREPPEAFSGEQSRNVAGVPATHFWFDARNRLIADAMVRHAPAARTFLEVGCGTGMVLRGLAALLPRVGLTAVEASLPSLRHAAGAAPQAELILADTRQLPFEDEFDVAGAFDVLEHIDDDDSALRAIVRAVKPGGLVLVTVPQHPWLWSTLDDYSGHKRRYRRSGLVGLAAAAGLDVVRVTSFVSLLLPAMILSRLVYRHAAVVPQREFEVSDTLNRLASRVMRAELSLIRAGLSLPAGGSLLLAGLRR